MFRITEAHGDLDTVTRLYHQAVNMASVMGTVGMTMTDQAWLGGDTLDFTLRGSVTIERV